MRSPTDVDSPAPNLAARSRLENRAMWLGVVASSILAATIVIAGLKAGITPGVSPLVVLLAWAVFARTLRTSSSTLILNQAQVAGSAGAAVSAGVIFTAPLLPILSHAQGLPYDGLPLGKLILASLAGALIGFGYVGLNARRVLADASLPAPEARAAEAMVRVATLSEDELSEPSSATPALRPDGRPLDTRKPRLARSLIPGMVLGMFAPLSAAIGLSASHIVLFAQNFGANGRSFEVRLPWMPIYFGIGGLLGVGTALVAFLGTLVRLTGDLSFATFDPDPLLWPETSLRWVGGGAMTVAVLWSIVRVVQITAQRDSDVLGTTNPKTLEISSQARRRLWGNVAVGSLLLLVGTLALSGVSAFSLSLALTVSILAAFMVALGALLSLQIGSSASPVSGTVFLMTLALCSVALLFGRGGSAADLELMTLVLVAACVAVCTSNDSSQDYRTLQLCNVPVERGFTGQWLGLISAAIVVPITIVLAEKSYGLGTLELPAPQGQLFATLVEGMLFEQHLPWRPILVGVAIGAAAVLLERIAHRRGASLPAMAFAVGLYLPPELGIGLVIGALARYAGDRAKLERSESILAAGGLITGAAAFDILLGVALLAGVETSQLRLFAFPAFVLNATALAGIAMVVALLYTRARGDDDDTVETTAR